MGNTYIYIYTQGINWSKHTIIQAYGEVTKHTIRI